MIVLESKPSWVRKNWRVFIQISTWDTQVSNGYEFFLLKGKFVGKLVHAIIFTASKLTVDCEGRMIFQLDTVTKKLSSSHERCHFDACLSNRSALISLDHSFSPSLYTLGNTFWQMPMIGSGLHHRAYERRSILAARLLINPRKIQKRKHK